MTGSDEPEMSLLVEGAARLGFELSAMQLAQFGLYYATLVDWNSRMNLTAITDPEGVQVKHFVDSLAVGAALLAELAQGGEKPHAPPEGFMLTDIGTGAGFPGMPLKILWPHIEVTLTDSIGKKTAFLKALAGGLGLEGVNVVTGRVEELGQDKAHRQRYDAATARAVASLPVLCEYLLPLIKVGGVMLAPKKGDISLEINSSEIAAPKLGGAEPRLHRFELAGDSDERYVVAVRKVKPTPPGYPRRVGLAKQKPLGAG